MDTEKAMVERKTWDEFRDAKLLWWINRMLHLFGWAIVVDVDSDGKVTVAYPARVGFRGFDDEIESSGFVGLTEYLKANIEELEREARQ